MNKQTECKKRRKHFSLIVLFWGYLGGSSAFALADDSHVTLSIPSPTGSTVQVTLVSTNGTPQSEKTAIESLVPIINEAIHDDPNHHLQVGADSGATQGALLTALEGTVPANQIDIEPTAKINSLLDQSRKHTLHTMVLFSGTARAAAEFGCLYYLNVDIGAAVTMVAVSGVMSGVLTRYNSQMNDYHGGRFDRKILKGAGQIAESFLSVLDFQRVLPEKMTAQVLERWSASPRNVPEIFNGRVSQLMAWTQKLTAMFLRSFGLEFTYSAVMFGAGAAMGLSFDGAGGAVTVSTIALASILATFGQGVVDIGATLVRDNTQNKMLEEYSAKTHQTYSREKFQEIAEREGNTLPSELYGSLLSLQTQVDGFSAAVSIVATIGEFLKVLGHPAGDFIFASVAGGGVVLIGSQILGARQSVSVFKRIGFNVRKSCADLMRSTRSVLYRHRGLVPGNSY